MRISIALLPKLFLKKDSELQSWIASVAPLIVWAQCDDDSGERTRLARTLRNWR